jgi:cation diffusion facilitator CzcD-associated flavoprotein CzcO
MDRSVDITVVGAGFAGMYAIHRARALGMSVQVFEAGTDVGGTWYWNRYPGARCDVESVEYSYSFDDDLQQEWEWTERYSAQPEILRYAQHVAERFDLRRDIQFSTRVISAHFDETSNTWTTKTDCGDVVTSQFIIFATGCLSSTNMPHFEGADSFSGETYHTGQWPHEGVDFTGKRVGIIGTGSSAVQSIPKIAEQADHLYVFQRTASFAVPARNEEINHDYVNWVKENYSTFRDANRQMSAAFGSTVPRGEKSALDVDKEELWADLEARWNRGGFGFLSGFTDFLLDIRANDLVSDFVRSKIADIVKDPETAHNLMPSQVLGCKRLIIDTGYYETFNRDNVTLVPVDSHPIEHITSSGIVTGGQEYACDAIVYATGFDAMTGSLLKIDIRGRGNQSLADAWNAGPVTYLGLMTSGFPNMFMVSGPGSPSVLTNMIMSIEQHVEWITDCFAHMRTIGTTCIETSDTAQDEWVHYVNAVAERTLYPSCNSWYLGANVEGKPRVFMPLIGFPGYVTKCNEVVASGYRGFQFS